MTSTQHRTPVELTISLSEEAPIESVGAAVRSCALGNGLNAERATRLQVVVEELVREARHREMVDGDGVIETTVSFDGTVLRVAILDHRLPMSSGESRHLPSRRLLAMGFVDRLHVGFKGSVGNLAECEVAVTSFDDAPIGDEVLGPDAPDAPDEVADTLIIRRMTTDDIEGLIRCIYRCYGYTYPDAMMYEAKHVRRLLQSGSMYSVVAQTADGEIVGHCAIVFDRTNDPVPEAGRMIVDPRFRGHHLAERMAELRHQIAFEAGVSGIYSKCVTNHVASQQAALRRGAVEVGLMLGMVGGQMVMTGLPSSAGGRKSLMAVFIACTPQQSGTLSVAERHGEMMQRLVERTGLDRDFSHELVEPASAETLLRVSVSAAFSAAEIVVSQIGSDLVDRLADELDGFRSMDLAVIELDLPMHDVSAAWAVEKLEHMGFTWCAWLPEFDETGDVQRLQRVTDRPIDFEGIACARPEGVEVRDFTISEWRRVQRSLIGG